MKQFTMVTAKSDFNFKAPGAKGRPVKVKTGDLFLVTSPQHMNKEAVMIDRKKQAHINSGYCFGLDTLMQYFSVGE
jgi:hypothetical protein